MQLKLSISDLKKYLSTHPQLENLISEDSTIAFLGGSSGTAICITSADHPEDKVAETPEVKEVKQPAFGSRKARAATKKPKLPESKAEPEIHEEGEDMASEEAEAIPDQNESVLDGPEVDEPVEQEESEEETVEEEPKPKPARKSLFAGINKK